MRWKGWLYTVLACAWAVGSVQAQACSFSIAGLNGERAVIGPVHPECPGSIHSTPFGNSGANSPFGSKRVVLMRSNTKRQSATSTARKTARNK